ncbi:hypothetical protein [Streptomyces longwoodensis]|uniref:hypothetical protein n=1 Tax=Streptomyces longwoodensis TaxID=68231 RepID=UPI0038503937
MAAMTRTGTLTGEILLWDVTASQRIGTLPSRAVSVPFSTSYLTGPLGFDADGSRLAVQNTDGQVRVWDVSRRKPLPGGAPATGNDALIGFGPGHSVVTSVFGKDVVRIHDLTNNSASGTLPVADADFVAGSVRNHRLTATRASCARPSTCAPTSSSARCVPPSDVTTPTRRDGCYRRAHRPNRRAADLRAKHPYVDGAARHDQGK